MSIFPFENVKWELKDCHYPWESLVNALPDIILKCNPKECEKHSIYTKDVPHSSTMCNKKLYHGSIKIITMEHKITARIVFYIMWIEKQIQALKIHKMSLIKR